MTPGRGPKDILVNEAAKRLKPEVTCTFTEDVQIFLTGGMPVNIELLEKDDEIYFAFDGGDWWQKRQIDSLRRRLNLREARNV